MEQRVPNFFQLLGSKKVGMVGLGVTNNGIAKMLAAKGIHVTIHDRQERAELGDICREMEEAGVSLVLGHDYLRRLEEDIIFRAPGVPFDLPELAAARKAGKVITSDLEMFFDLCPCPIIGVTGSDGKTTTTTLIAEMLRAEGKTVHLGGNIGHPLLSETGGMRAGDIAVLELLFATGARVSELCALQCGDVRLEEGEIKIYGKGAKERFVQIANLDVLNTLCRYQEVFQDTIDQAGAFFVNRSQRPLSTQSVRAIVNRYSTLANVKNHITPHMFRHSFATLLLEEGVDIRYIQQLLGHSSIVTTQIYTHVAGRKQRDILLEKHPRNKLHSI